MKRCPSCGQNVADNYAACPYCGTMLTYVASPAPVQNANVPDAPSTGFAILGFFIPIVGLILYLVNKDTAPLKAKSAGKGALIGFIVNIVFTVIYVILYVIVIMFLLGSGSGVYF